MNSNKLSASIIIPVFNDAASIAKLLTALQSVDFTYPYEVIIVDNGSTDNTMSIVKQFDDVKLLTEHHFLNSPYSSRNRGIEQATGDVIILLDSTCVPVKTWFNNGIECLTKNESDIIGGDVRFDFEGKMTAGKIYDSLTNIKMKESIEDKGVAKTANLFIRKKVFDDIGLFPEGVRSGADVIWTGRAKKMNQRLCFCQNATVYKQARSFSELIKKQWRVGLHQPLIWEEENRVKSFPAMLVNFLKPVLPSNVWQLIKTKGTIEMRSYFLRILFTAQIIKWVSNLANMKGSFRFRK